MSNNLILSFINEYIVNPDPQYAVMLKGKWGCGKTFFIKKWLKQYNEGVIDEDAELISIKPIYVSLYGMNSISEIKTALDREINPFFYTKGGKALKKFFRLAGKVVFKTNLDITNDGDDDTSFSGTLDSLAIFNTDEDVVKGVKFIVFDDIERCNVDIVQLLGFINYFVEHCGCHVVIIGDDTHLDESKRKQLDEFKEKTIGREFEIMPDEEGAIGFFLSEIPKSSFLESKKELIIKCFRATENNNLRILRQCLNDFKTQLRGINEKLISKDCAFLNNLLCSFIAVYAEYNNKDNHDDIVDWTAKYQMALLPGSEDKRTKLKSLIGKYRITHENNIYFALDPEYTRPIVQHISTGKPLTEYIASQLSNNSTETPPWVKLRYFWELSDEEFDSIYNKSIDDLLNNRISPVYQVGETIGYLCYLDAISVKFLIQAHISLIKRLIRSLLNNAINLDDMYTIRSGIYQGCSYVRDENVQIPIVSDILQFLSKEVDRREKELPDHMQEALRTLSENNVDKLIIIDDITHPNRQSNYQLRAIFSEEDAKLIFENIKNLSNKGRNTFGTFLSKHYMLDIELINADNRYASDIRVLQQLKAFSDEMISATKSIEQLSYKNLRERLQKSILRCKGKPAR